jgi:hypothetical protein
LLAGGNLFHQRERSQVDHREQVGAGHGDVGRLAVRREANARVGLA